MVSKNQTILTALKTLINQGGVGTQQEICEELTRQGFNINQSKVSRLMRNLRVVKVKNTHGKTVYCLPSEPAPPSTESSLTHLIMNILANESLIVIRTSPGSAALIARLLDYRSTTTAILGTIAGDDTIFIAPRSVENIQQAIEEVKLLLSGIHKA